MSSLNKKIQDITRLNILCKPIGASSYEGLQDLMNLLNQEAKQIAFSSFYLTELKDKVKTSFPERVPLF